MISGVSDKIEAGLIPASGVTGGQAQSIATR